MLGSYDKNRDIWIEIVEKIPTSIAILRVSTDDNGKPVDLIYDYVNQEYANLYGIKKEDRIGMSIKEYKEVSEPKYIINAWESACNGKTKEMEDFDSRCGKYLRCKYVQIEYGICGCVYEDTTLNTRMFQMLQEIGANFDKNSFDYLFEYNEKTDVFRVVKHFGSSEDNLLNYREVADFSKLISEKNHKYIDKKSAATLCRILKEDRVGTYYINVLSYVRTPNKMCRYKINCWNVEGKDGEHKKIGTILKVE